MPLRACPPTVPNAFVLASVDLGRRTGCFYRRKLFENPVGVPCASGHNPGIARLQQNHLPFQTQLGTALNDVANGLIVALCLRFRLAGRLVFPESHGEMHAHRQVLLAPLATRRIVRIDLNHAGIRHSALLLYRNWAPSGPRCMKERRHDLAQVPRFCTSALPARGAPPAMKMLLPSPTLRERGRG